jgi:hypothetical protein
MSTINLQGVIKLLKTDEHCGSAAIMGPDVSERDA